MEGPDSAQGLSQKGVGQGIPAEVKRQGGGRLLLPDNNQVSPFWEFLAPLGQPPLSSAPSLPLR